MIVVENIPLFRTITPVAVAGAATDPALSTERQPLPADLWRTGFATFAEARRYQKGIEGYRTRCGRGDDGFYVAAPGSGLCAVVVPYAQPAEAADGFSVEFDEVSA